MLFSGGAVVMVAFPGLSPHGARAGYIVDEGGGGDGKLRNVFNNGTKPFISARGRGLINLLA